MSATTIKRVLVEPLTINRDEPFTIATGVKYRTENAVIRLLLENGVEGYGEAAPLEPINGENQATALATLHSCEAFLLGQDVDQFRTLSASLKQVFWAQVTARCAIEIALLDAFTKTLGLPLYKFWGGAQRQLETDYTISIVPPQTAQAEAIKLAQAGYRTLKIKVGKNVDEDVERVLAVGQAAPHCRITLDANQGYTVSQALRCLDMLQAHGLLPALLEQPVARRDLEGMRLVRQKANVPVAADESVFSAQDALSVVKTGCADIVNIKIMKSGLIEALDIAAIVRSANLGLMIGCMLETTLALSASVHLAAGLGGFDFIDLDPQTPSAQDPFTGGPGFVAPLYTLPDDTPGLGVVRRGEEI